MISLIENILEEDIPVLTCEHCVGGYVDIGKHHCPCVYCGGTGEINEHDLVRKAGVEIILCHRCLGDGHYQCPHCEGEGGRWNSIDENWDECNECEGGEMECRYCLADGYIIVRHNKEMKYTKQTAKWVQEYAERLMKAYKRTRY